MTDRMNVCGRTIEWIRERCEVDANGCWIWTGSVQSKGYPVCGIPGKRSRTQLVHRLALAIKLGHRVDGMSIHSCDVRRCCNPDHLRDGSAHDNMRDAKERGRLRTGERNPSSRITAVQARDVKLMVDKGVPIATVSRATGIARHVVVDIANDATWSHATGTEP